MKKDRTLDYKQLWRNPGILENMSISPAQAARVLLAASSATKFENILVKNIVILLLILLFVFF